jgi:7-keto-8-aminopelargonate synthetase-like enzyme
MVLYQHGFFVAPIFISGGSDMAYDKKHLSLLVSSFNEFAQSCRDEGVYGDLFVIEEKFPGMRVRLQGIGEVSSFMNLEYLDISRLPEIVEVGREALLRYGSGFASSRTTIDSVAHLEFEADLADFKRAGACILTSRGYDASFMLVSLYAGPIRALRKRFSSKRRSVVFMDEFSHASLQDAFLSLRGSQKREGNRMANEKYRHLDYGQLEELLATTTKEDVDRFIVTDGLFSAHGDFADIRRLLGLAKKYCAFLLIDGAHSDGVYGPEGRGVVDMAGIVGDDLDYIFQSGTLSKAFGGMGGYLTAFPASAELARYSQGEHYIFSAAMPMAHAATYRKTLEVIRSEEGDRRRKHLEHISAYVRDTLRAEGFDIFQTTSHIVPVRIGEDALSLEVQQYLVREHGVLCAAFREPAVPRGEAIIRIALSAGHSDTQIEQLLSGLRAARDKFRF